MTGARMTQVSNETNGTVMWFGINNSFRPLDIALFTLIITYFSTGKIS
jgi:hypothetical protein